MTDLEALPYAFVGACRGVWEEFLKPNPGITAWGATLGVAFAYDAWALRTDHETMSHTFHRGYESPYKLLCVGALGALAVHLLHGPE